MVMMKGNEIGNSPILLACLIALTCAGLTLSFASSAVVDSTGEIQAPFHGELHIQGSFIKRLRLVGPEQNFEVSNPGQVVMVPVGRYTDQEVLLEARDPSIFAVGYLRNELFITQKSPATLSVGTPFRQGIEVRQTGRKLHFHSYHLLDTEKNRYLFREEDKRLTSLIPIGSEWLENRIKTECAKGSAIANLIPQSGRGWQYWIINRDGDTRPLLFSIRMAGLPIASGWADYG